MGRGNKPAVPPILTASQRSTQSPTAEIQRLASLLTLGVRLKLLGLCDRSPEQLERELQPASTGRGSQSLPLPPCRLRRNVPPGLLSSFIAFRFGCWLYYPQKSRPVKRAMHSALPGLVIAAEALPTPDSRVSLQKIHTSSSAISLSSNSSLSRG